MRSETNSFSGVFCFHSGQKGLLTCPLW